MVPQTPVMSYASLGGVLSASELLLCSRPYSEQPISRIARWIVRREAVQFALRGEAHFPLFQFEHGMTRVRPAVRRVIDELRPLMSDEELADWFARSNAWLSDCAPADPSVGNAELI